MEKLKILQRINELYANNQNIIKYLKELDGNERNAIEDILISYDFQSGTYIESYKTNPIQKDEYCNQLAKILNQLEYRSLLEVGVGEATTLGPLLQRLEVIPDKCFGFDLSWSRVKFANNFLGELGYENVELFTGDMFDIPLKDNSIDIVYSSHSVEPNGGREKEALEELYRITNKYLILLEPSFEFANEEGKSRMREHGYVTELYATVKDLGYEIIEHRLFEVSSNPLNPTGLMIIRKESDEEVLEPLCCPVTKTDIIKTESAYFSSESLLAYPVIQGIPCLLPQNAIVATKFLV
ncbi:methyltransferase domain-containing protein [Oceanobacillus chungangensis]|uniref:Methyltransferase domain-containing protein n=1 Tax=Oceanobacillus chungangensis TaxID=1229152 RepID=A0A3D8PYX9_9BACI|nr:methyltransferase domain-containing protein [Oceanobacillus chungangensis]RDW20777.1 hypothetical protein CWR45_06010 [Oceanobacillus chungangensis]